MLIIAITVSCGGDGNGGDDPIPETSATTLERLQGTWTLSSVTRDGNDVTSEFDGFAIAISNTSYTITNGGTAWSVASGSMGINGDTAVSIDSMGGNTNISIAFSNSDKTLTLTVSVANSIFGGGRVSSLAGNYVFVLTK